MWNAYCRTVQNAKLVTVPQTGTRITPLKLCIHILISLQDNHLTAKHTMTNVLTYSVLIVKNSPVVSVPPKPTQIISKILSMKVSSSSELRPKIWYTVNCKKSP